MVKNIVLWVVIAVVLISVFNNFSPPPNASRQLSYSEFVDAVNNGDVKEVMIDGRNIHGTTQGGDVFSTYSPGDPGLVGDLLDQRVVISAWILSVNGMMASLLMLWGWLLGWFWTRCFSFY